MRGKTVPNPTRIPLGQILVEDSPYGISHLKRRLISEGHLDDLCSKCGITEWNGKALVLHLDHINGKNRDHRLVNLRLLCPNCHSQTSTYCGRNKRITIRATEYPCVTCGTKQVRKPTSRCRSCAASGRPTKITWPSASELRARVTQDGYAQVGRDLGVSDNAVRKHLAS